MTDRQMLSAYPLRLVGSALSKQKPRDLDLIMIIPDLLFEELFGPVAKWRDEGQSGEYTAVRTSWNERCIRLGRMLSRSLQTALPVDFKILPASLHDHGKKGSP